MQISWKQMVETWKFLRFYFAKYFSDVQKKTPNPTKTKQQQQKNNQTTHFKNY